LEEVPVTGTGFTSEDQAVEYAIHNQRDRRNLLDPDIARLVALVDERKRQGERTDLREDNLTQDCVKLKPSSHATAETLGISPRKVEQTRTVLDHAPEAVKRAVNAGRMSINRAYRETQQQRSPRKEVTPEETPEERDPVQVTAEMGPDTTVRIPPDLAQRLKPWGDLEGAVIRAVQEFLDRHEAQASADVQEETAAPSDDPIEERIQGFGCRACVAFRRTADETVCRWLVKTGGERLDLTAEEFTCPKMKPARHHEAVEVEPEASRLVMEIPALSKAERTVRDDLHDLLNP
jgi:hypothetical protein